MEIRVRIIFCGDLHIVAQIKSAGAKQRFMGESRIGEQCALRSVGPWEAQNVSPESHARNTDLRTNRQYCTQIKGIQIWSIEL